MSESKQQVCFHWINKGKCKFGRYCRYFHPTPRFGVPVFGDCLDFAKGINLCKGPEFCLYQHHVDVGYSNNPCQLYTQGFCSLGWACPGKHCVLQAAAELTSHGVQPPQHLLLKINKADEFWSQNLNSKPIFALRFLAVIQQFFMLLIPDKKTTRSLAETIAEYAISLPFHGCGCEQDCDCEERFRWTSMNCTPYRMRESCVNGKLDVFSFPDRWSSSPGCSFCHESTLTGATLSLGKESVALACLSCTNYTSSRGPRDSWSWKNGIPTPSNVDAALELFGCSLKDKVIHLSEKTNIFHDKNGCILVNVVEHDVHVQRFAGPCPECLKK